MIGRIGIIGRIEAKADRAGGVLRVLKVWREPKIKWTAQRHAKLQAELDRMARFVGVASVDWACGPPE